MENVHRVGCQNCGPFLGSNYMHGLEVSGALTKGDNFNNAPWSFFVDPCSSLHRPHLLQSAVNLHKSSLFAP